MKENESMAHLLEQVSTCLNENNDEDMVETISENFNIVQFSEIYSDEGSFYSRIIKELLHPYEDSGNPTNFAFFKLFFEECGLDKFSTFNGPVYIKQNKCPIQLKETKGISIDLVFKIVNHNCTIVIKNRIDGVDQSEQLLYYKNTFPNVKIIILDLEENDDITNMVDGNKFDKFVLILRKKEILNWLKKAANLADKLPEIQHKINFCVIFLQYLIKQNSKIKMSNKMTEIILSSKTNLDTAYLIQNQLEIIKQELIKELEVQFKEPIYKRLAVKYNIEFFAEKRNYMNFGTIGYYIKIANVLFSFGLNYRLSGSLYITLIPVDSEKEYDKDFSKFINSRITKIPNDNYSDYEFWRHKENFEYNYINNPDAIMSINSGKSIDYLYNLIDTVLSDLQDLLEPPKI